MLHVLTVATHSERYLPVLDKQVKDSNLELQKLGMGKDYKGHFMKDLEVMEYVKKINKDDLIVFVDGFDSLMLSSQEEILKKFESFNCDLLLSVENVGMLSFIHDTVFEKVRGKYINTGLYMGKAGFILSFLEEIYADDSYNKKSNQKSWCSHLFKLITEKRFDNIALDVNSDIFLNHSFTTSNYIEMNSKRIILNGESKPCFIQGNGCEDMNYIIDDLGYSAQNVHTDTFLQDKMKYNINAVFKTYSPILSFYIYVVILFVIIIIYLSFSIYKNRNDTNFYF